MRHLAPLPMALLFLLPLAASLAFVLPGLIDRTGFAGIFSHPQFAGAVLLSVFTGIVSTLLALLLSLAIVYTAGGANAARRAPVFLAVPHLSFAIGLSFLLMPTGALARVAALVMGWSEPPQWVVTQDPWGLSLISALVLKETPFLVWAFASLLNRDDLRLQFRMQASAARSLGHGEGQTFLRIILPQLLPRAAGPLIAVLAYGMTVVDMALVIGPTQPPTLAQLVWSDLNDAEAAHAARGGAGVLLLSGLVLLTVALAAAAVRLARAWLHRVYSSPAFGSARASGHGVARPVFNAALPAIYALVLAITLLQSLAGRWPFPLLMPQALTLQAWLQVISASSAMLTTLLLAVATTLTAVVAAVLAMEWGGRAFGTIVIAAALLVLCLPALQLAVGEYRLFLRLGITGTASAMFLAHLLPVMAYVVLMLNGPYRAFDQRLRSAAAGLSAPRLRFLTSVKWPMLRTPLLASAAVGFAVSVAQYVPAQLAAAGRFTTLPMDAVTLSSGGNRPLLAAYGLALAAFPLAAFLLAGRLGRPRWAGH